MYMYIASPSGGCSLLRLGLMRVVNLLFKTFCSSAQLLEQKELVDLSGVTSCPARGCVGISVVGLRTENYS